MLKSLLLAAGLALAVPSYAADRQKSEAEAIPVCEQGSLVWIKPDSDIYHRPARKTKDGELTCHIPGSKEHWGPPR